MSQIIVDVDLSVSGLEAAASGLQALDASLDQLEAKGPAVADALGQIGQTVSSIDLAGVASASAQIDVLSASTAASTGVLADYVPQTQAAAAATTDLGAAAGGVVPQHQAHTAAAGETTRSLGELATSTRELANEAIPGLGTALSAVTGLFGATSSGLKSAADEEQSFTASSALMGAGLTAAGVAAAGGFFAVFDSGLTTMKNTAAQFGLTIPEVAGLQTALGSVGLPAQAADMALRQMSVQLQTIQGQLDAGKDPSGRFAAGLDAIGVSAVGSSGHVASLQSLLPQVFDAFAAAAQHAQATGQTFDAAGVAAQLFGTRAGPQMVPLLLEGAAGYEDYTAKAKALGIGSEEQVAHLEALHKATADTSLELKGMAMAIGSDVAPAFTTAIGLAGDAATAYGKLPTPIRDLIVTLPLAAGGTMLLASGLSAVGGVVGTVTDSFGALSTALGITTAAEEAETVAAEGAEVATASVVPAIGLVVAATAAVAIGLHAWMGSADAASASQKALSQAAQQAAQSIDQETQAAIRSGQSLPSVADQLHAKQQQAIADNDAASAALEAYTAKLAALSGGQIKSTADLTKHDATFKALSDDVAKTSAQVSGYDVALGKLAAQAASTGQSLDHLAASGDAWGPQDSLLRIFTSDLRDAGTTVAGLSQEVDTSGVRLAGQADAMKTLDDATKRASSSVQEQGVFQQQLADAIAHYSDNASQAAVWHQKLKDLADSGDSTLKTYADDQLKLDDAVNVLGPDVAALTAQHQGLADALGITTSKTLDANDRFQDTINLLHDTASSAQEAGEALLGMLSKPNQAELDAQAGLAATKSQLADLNAELADASPAEQHIAALEHVYQNDLRTGASTDTVAKAKAELDNALANSSPAAAAGVALQDHIDHLKRDETSQQANYDQLRAGREAMSANATAQNALVTNTAASTQQQADAYGVYEQRVTGTLNRTHDTVVTTGTKTGTDGTAAVASSLAAGSPQIADAGTANVTAYGKALQAGYDTTKTDATNAAAQFAGALTDPAAFGKAGTSDGQAFGAALLTEIQAAMKKAAAAVQPGGATIPGIASAAGTPGYRGPSAGGFLLPAQGPVTQPFGPTDETAEPAYGGYAHFHEGLDLGVPAGTPLAAGEAGTVEAVTNQGQSGLGLSVTIDFPDGTKEILGHLTEALVGVGDQVTQGEAVGLSGGAVGSPTSGASTGPHVHVQVEDASGTPIDPESLLGQLLGGGSGASATATVNLAGNSGDHLLTPAEYAAIQAHESTLPLPSPGSPEPMFGLTNGAAGAYAVGNQILTSGGTAAASATMDLPPGYTKADLLPSVDAGESAFDDLVRRLDPAAAAFIQQTGDFAGFMQRIAPWYAGPGEAPGFASGTIANFQGGVGDIAGLTGHAPGFGGAVANAFGAISAAAGSAPGSGGPDELPPPALGNPNQDTIDATQKQRDLNALQSESNSLAKDGLDLKKQTTDDTALATQAEVDGLHQTTEGYRTVAVADQGEIQAKYNLWQAAVQSYDGSTAESAKSSQAQIDQAKATYDAAKGLYSGDIANFDDALSQEGAAQSRLDAQKQASAQATTALHQEQRQATQTDLQQTQQLGDAYGSFAADAGVAAAEFGQQWGAAAQQNVVSAEGAASGARQAYQAAEQAVLADERALTGEMTGEDRKRLQSKLATDSQTRDDAKATYGDELTNLQKADAAYHQYVTDVGTYIQQQKNWTNELTVLTAQANVQMQDGSNSTLTVLSDDAKAKVALAEGTQTQITNLEALSLPQELAWARGPIDARIAALKALLPVQQDAANKAIANSQAVATAEDQADAKITSLDAMMFDNKLKGSHLSEQEQAAGLGRVLADENAIAQQIINLEQQILQAKDAAAIAALNVQIGADQKRLASAQETAREIEATIQASGASGGGAGGTPANAPSSSDNLAVAGRLINIPDGKGGTTLGFSGETFFSSVDVSIFQDAFLARANATAQATLGLVNAWLQSLGIDPSKVADSVKLQYWPDKDALLLAIWSLYHLSPQQNTSSSVTTQAASLPALATLPPFTPATLTLPAASSAPAFTSTATPTTPAGTASPAASTTPPPSPLDLLATYGSAAMGPFLGPIVQLMQGAGWEGFRRLQDHLGDTGTGLVTASFSAQTVNFTNAQTVNLSPQQVQFTGPAAQLALTVIIQGLGQQFSSNAALFAGQQAQVVVG